MNLAIRNSLLLMWFLIFAALALTGCVGARMGVSWPAVGLIELYGETHIAIAYNNDVAILSPSNGAPARLINPLNGEVMRDNENNPRTWILRGSENEGSQFFSVPIRIDEDTVLIADNNKRLLRVDSVVVEVQRAYPLADKVLTNTLLAGDTLYLPFQNGGLTAVALGDFQERWTLTTDAGIWAQPLLVDDRLIVPSIDHFLYAVDRSTGERFWSLDLGGAVASTPLLANGRLYVGSFDKSFFEISLDGEILNKFGTQNWVWGTPAADENGIIYVADLSGYVHALDGDNGLRERWSVQIAERGIRAGPLVFGERVIVASRDGKVYWLDKRDGQLINAREIDDRPELLGDMMILKPSENLAIDEPLLLVSSVHDGRLLIAFGVDGRQTWVYPR